MCYVDVTVRIYDKNTIKQLNFLRKKGTNITELVKNAILTHNTKIKETEKKL